MTTKTRLPLLPPECLNADQKDLYDDMAEVIEANFGELVARRDDGALIGPFNGWLHFPHFGAPHGPSTGHYGNTLYCPPPYTNS